MGKWAYTIFAPVRRLEKEKDVDYEAEQDGRKNGGRYLFDSAILAVVVFFIFRSCTPDAWADYKVGPDQQYTVSWTQEGDVDGFEVEKRTDQGQFVQCAVVVDAFYQDRLGAALVAVYRIRSFRNLLGETRIYSEYSDPSDPVISTTAPPKPCGTIITIP